MSQHTDKWLGHVVVVKDCIILNQVKVDILKDKKVVHSMYSNNSISGNAEVIQWIDKNVVG